MLAQEVRERKPPKKREKEREAKPAMTLRPLYGSHGFSRHISLCGPARGLKLHSANRDSEESQCIHSKEQTRALVSSFCHSFNIYLLSTYCVPDTVPDTRYISDELEEW